MLGLHNNTQTNSHYASPCLYSRLEKPAPFALKQGAYCRILAFKISTSAGLFSTIEVLSFVRLHVTDFMGYEAVVNAPNEL